MTCTNDCQRPTPAQAHCGACHRTFGSVSGFDRHRRGGECLNPANVGFTETGRIWRRPMSKSGAARVDRLRLVDERPSLVGADDRATPTA